MSELHTNHNAKRPVVGRFAPSPTGRMHAGNVFASLVAWLVAKAQDGRMVLRIEDLDQTRSRQEYVDQVMRDYELLGLTWDEGPFYQSGRDEAYRLAFDLLGENQLTYPCFCTRADLKAASAPHRGEHQVYAGTCKGLSAAEQQARDALVRSQGRPGPSWRLDVSRACQARSEGSVFAFRDQVAGDVRQDVVSQAGDVVIRRADGSFAYQLAVVCDDAVQGVTSVVRGNDLLDSCCQQMLLQESLGLPGVTYAHVPLICAPTGERLAKRHKAAHLDALLQEYGSPQVLLGRIAALSGLLPQEEPVTPEDLLALWGPRLAADPCCLQQLWGSVATLTWE
ncbi:MAG: tRNA glutamyl-Q(34) synthetase GluQRS [Coriobacteriia bacterium]|nr:tRNA glutamyl-Q(34) synthetase GluQRS [Coriobacteriia bacterium]